MIFPVADKIVEIVDNNPVVAFRNAAKNKTSNPVIIQINIKIIAIILKTFLLLIRIVNLIIIIIFNKGIHSLVNQKLFLIWIDFYLHKI